MTQRIPWWLPQVGDREHTLIDEVLAGNFLNDGDYTTRFENELAARLGCKYAVAVTSGTSALFAALVALGIGPGDEVIVPDVTFIATANAVTWAGATPVLVDVCPDTLTIDPDAVARAITSRTRAVIPVHVSGRPADLTALLDLARRHNLALLEDAAEALLSRYHGRCLGTLGQAGCFSFSPNKTITTGQGGAVVTNDERLHLRLREIKDQGRRHRGTGGNDIHPCIGYNLKFTNLQAAVGLAQLDYLDERVERLRNLYRAYHRQLVDIDGLTLLSFDLNDGAVPQWMDVLTDQRDELDRDLREHHMDCRPFWYPIHTQAPYRLSDDVFPHSSRQVPRAMWLPSAFTLTDEDVARVCGQVRRFFSKTCVPVG
jgi:perosamine synthetase